MFYQESPSPDGLDKIEDPFEDRDQFEDRPQRGFDQEARVLLQSASLLTQDHSFSTPSPVVRPFGTPALVPREVYPQPEQTPLFNQNSNNHVVTPQKKQLGSEQAGGSSSSTSPFVVVSASATPRGASNTFSALPPSRPVAAQVGRSQLSPPTGGVANGPGLARCDDQDRRTDHEKSGASSAGDSSSKGSPEGGYQIGREIVFYTLRSIQDRLAHESKSAEARPRPKPKEPIAVSPPLTEQGGTTTNRASQRRTGATSASDRQQAVPPPPGFGQALYSVTSNFFSKWVGGGTGSVNSFGHPSGTGTGPHGGAKHQHHGGKKYKLVTELSDFTGTSNSSCTESRLTRERRMSIGQIIGDPTYGMDEAGSPTSNEGMVSGGASSSSTTASSGGPGARAGSYYYHASHDKGFNQQVLPGGRANDHDDDDISPPDLVDDGIPFCGDSSMTWQQCANRICFRSCVRCMKCFDYVLRALGPLLVILAFCLYAFCTWSYLKYAAPAMEIDEVTRFCDVALGLFILWNILYNHWSAIRTNPGNPPKYEANNDELNEMLEARVLDVPHDLESGMPKICHKCDRIKPLRAHHCSVCGKCINKMDHHCPWINNCVGFGNYQYFVLFLFWLYCGTVFVLATAFPQFYEIMYRPERSRHRVFQSREYVGFMYVLCASINVGISILGGFHLYLLLTNQTTIEFQIRFATKRSQRNEYDLGPLYNYRQVMGDSCLFGCFPWLGKSKRRPEEGLSFPKATRFHI